ncbi:hypothetical protein ACRALDRAFT_1075269 [Sodiomyces alcalophilus JCM 7366]|uniref:uncharacterized protein n=1 Tax=Sodiomyces alcalophilus JCM 7366 TaxID=591952 RepID=UPI0039B5CFA4
MATPAGTGGTPAIAKAGDAAGNGNIQQRHTIFLDELGDLRLRCGAELKDVQVQDFVVCSRTLARASPVLRVMAHGPFAESKINHDVHTKDHEWVIDLPEDKPRPFLDILNIIHGRFKLVLQKPTLSQLYDILTVTRKYDMAAVIKPWSDAWFKDVDLSHHVTDPRLLLVAREVGATKRFRELRTQWIKDGRLNADGEIFLGDAKAPPLSSYKGLHPSDLANEICKNRNEVVRFILDSWNQVAHTLLTADSTEKRVLAECAYLYGKMMRAASRHEGGKYLLSTPAQTWPLPAAELQSFINSLCDSDEFSSVFRSNSFSYYSQPTYMIFDNLKKSVELKMNDAVMREDLSRLSQLFTPARTPYSRPAPAALKNPFSF